MATAIAGSVDLESLLQRSADAARAVLRGDFVGLGLVDTDGAVVLRAVSAATPVTLTLGHRQPPGVGVTGEAIRTGAAVLVPDVRVHANIVPTGPELRSELCVPISLAGAPLGFLDVGASSRVLEDTDVDRAQQLAKLIAGPLHLAVAAQERESRRDELVAMLVHDLRNPTTVLSLNLELLGRERGGAPIVQRALREAREASEELLRLIDGILSVEKATAGRLVLRLAEVDAAALVAGVAGRMESLAAARQVRLQCRLVGGQPAMLLDADLLVRVLENLLANAIKYSPADEDVHVTAQPADAAVLRARGVGASRGLLITVQDAGPGVPEQDRARIFEKFGIVSGPRKGRYSTGLGLAFAQRAIVAHGGALWVEAGPEGGSCFRLLLPVRNDFERPETVEP